MEKNVFRKDCLLKRQQAIQQGFDQASLLHNISELLKNLKLSKVGAYKAKQDEVSVEPLDKGIEWFFPRVDGESLSFHRALASDDFEIGHFGVIEPKTSLPSVNLEELQAVLVPGVAFDRRGGRLGYGKAFYDKALLNKNVIKIGVTLKDLLVPVELPLEAHDINMDFIVTEKFVLQPNMKISV